MIDNNNTRIFSEVSMKKIVVKVCMGTNCFVKDASNLQELMEIIPARYGDKVDVFGVPCLGLCSIDWKNSRTPYVKVDDEIITEATVEKVINEIEAKLN